MGRFRRKSTDGKAIAISVKNLVRIYGRTERLRKGGRSGIVAVNDVSFDVQAGEFFGLLGPNGAGKTTTIKVLTTLLLPTSGKVNVNGYNVETHPREIRRGINVVFGGERGLHLRLNGRDNLRHAGCLYGLSGKETDERSERLLEMVGLGADAGRRVETYSRGMKQRLHIARALINNPEIVFLDEPTVGLDPEGAIQIRDMLKDLHKGGRTVFLTTHNMFEADELCERVGIVNQGQMIALGTPGDIKRLTGGGQVIDAETYGADESQMSELNRAFGSGLLDIEDIGFKRRIRIETSDVESGLERVRSTLGSALLDVRVKDKGLEEAYLALVMGCRR